MGGVLPAHTAQRATHGSNQRDPHHRAAPPGRFQPSKSVFVRFCFVCFVSQAIFFGGEGGVIFGGLFFFLFWMGGGGRPLLYYYIFCCCHSVVLYFFFFIVIIISSRGAQPSAGPFY